MALIPITIYGNPFTNAELVFLQGFADLTHTQGDVWYANSSGQVARLAAGTDGNVLTTHGAGANPTWTSTSGSGTVTTVSVATANGFSGTVANATTTPAITIIAGAITPTSVNGLTISTTTGIFTLTNAKTLSVTNTLTFSGTDSTIMTFPSTSATVARTDAANTFIGHQTIEGITSTGATGTGKFVFDTSPTLVTPVLGVATATSINGNIFTAGSSTYTGTAAQTYTFPTTTATIARTDAGQTFTGVQVMTSPKIITQISDTNGNILVNIGATASAVNYVKLTNAVTGTAGPIIAADGETNVDLKMAAKGTGKIHNTSGTYGDVTAYSPAGAGTATLTLNTSNIHAITMPAGNITIAISNDGVGQIFTIEILQDGTGSRTVTWFSGIKWAGGSVPTLTTTASKVDIFTFRVVTAGSAYYGMVSGQNI